MAGIPPADPRIMAQLTPPPEPTPAAPTASPQQLAMVDLALSDPLNQQLIQAYAPNAVTATGDIARDQAALYGAERFGKMQQLAQATASVRNQYLAALDAAQQAEPPAIIQEGVMGTSAQELAASAPPLPVGWHYDVSVDGEHTATFRAQFDVDAFTAWYAKQDTLASRAFATLYGGSSTTQEAHGGEQIVNRTMVGGEMFQAQQGYWSQIGEHGEKSGWVGSQAVYSGPVAVIDAQGHPDLINSQAVWFDPAMGFVTLRDNIKQKQNFLDKALPSLAAIGITAVTAGAGAFSSIGSLAGASGSMGATMLSAAAASAFTTLNSSLLANCSVHLKDVLKSALTGAVTAGLTNVAGLDKLGMQGNTVVSYADRAIAITGQATLQGALQQLAGGKFKDGFTAGLASGLAAEVTRGMQAGIDAKVKLGQMSGAEASACRLLTQATGSAIRMLSSPNDPGRAMAQDFLGTLVGDGAAAISQPAPMTLDQLRQSEHTQANEQAAAEAAIAAQETFRVSEHEAERTPAPATASSNGGTPGSEEDRLRLGQTQTEGGDTYRDPAGGDLASATGAVRGALRGGAAQAVSASRYLELLATAGRLSGPAAVLTVVIFGDQNMGSFENVVPMEDGKRFVKARDEMYGMVQQRNANGDWEITRTGVKAYYDSQMNKTVVLSDEELRRGPFITPADPPPTRPLEGYTPVDDQANTRIPGKPADEEKAPTIDGKPLPPPPRPGDLIFTKSNSEILGENMRKAGDHPPFDGAEPHHMVPSGAGGARMDAVRQLLTGLGVDLNDAVNGVWLPTSRSPQDAPGAYHPRLNNAEYDSAIIDAFRNVTTRQQAEATLRDIKTQLQNETFPGVRPRRR